MNLRGATLVLATLLTSTTGAEFRFGSLSSRGPVLGPAQSATIFLTQKVPATGILYKIEAYFVKTDPVCLQIWRPGRPKSNKFKLVYQKKYASDTVNATKTVYTVLDNSTDPECPIVRKGDRLGIFSPYSVTSIPALRRTRNEYKLFKNHSSPVILGVMMTFQAVINPNAGFPFIAYIDVIRRRVSSSVRRCPRNLMGVITMTPGWKNDTSPYHTYASTGDSMLTSASVDVVETTSAYEDAATKTLSIIIGVVVGVAAVGIILAVVMVMYCKRRARDKSSDTADLEPSNDKNGSSPSGTPASSTSNPAGGKRCEFRDTYEPPIGRCLRPPQVYQPIIPPRPGERALEQSISTPEGPGEQSDKPGAYEEIREIRPVGFLDKQNMNLPRDAVTDPGTSPVSASRQDSGLYEDVDPQRNSTYLELLPDSTEHLVSGTPNS